MTRRPAFNRNDFDNEVDHDEDDDTDFEAPAKSPSLLQRLFGRGAKNKRHDAENDFSDEESFADDDESPNTPRKHDDEESRWGDELEEDEDEPAAQNTRSSALMRMIAVVALLVAALVAGLYVWKPATAPMPEMSASTGLLPPETAPLASSIPQADAQNVTGSSLPVPISPDFDLRRPTDPFAAQ